LQQEIRTILAPEETYVELKRIALEEGCSIAKDRPPIGLEIEHGSWWGITAETIAKNIRFRIIPEERGSKIECRTFWPPMIGLGIVIAYVTILFIIFYSSFILSGLSPIPIILNPAFWMLIGLSGVVLVTVLLNLNGYMKRDIVAKRMLLLIAAFGSPSQISRPGGVRVVRKVVCIFCGKDNESMATQCQHCRKVFPGALRKEYQRRRGL
jgi:hypothetical protein